MDNEQGIDPSGMDPSIWRGLTQRRLSQRSMTRREMLRTTEVAPAILVCAEGGDVFPFASQAEVCGDN